MLGVCPVIVSTLIGTVPFGQAEQLLLKEKLYESQLLQVENLSICWEKYPSGQTLQVSFLSWGKMPASKKEYVLLWWNSKVILDEASWENDVLLLLELRLETEIKLDFLIVAVADPLSTTSCFEFPKSGLSSDARGSLFMVCSEDKILFVLFGSKQYLSSS